MRPEHQGAPGIAHGGVVAAAFDEVLGGLHWVLGVPWVTGRLLSEFVRPVPVGTELDLRAEVVSIAGRRAYCRGWAYQADEEAESALYARAAGVFVVVDLTHFSIHGAGFTSTQEPE